MSSLRARLFVGLAAFILMTGLAAGVMTFSWAFDEAIELQDAILLQVGALAAANRLQHELPAERGVDAVSRVVIEDLVQPQETGSTENSLLPLPANVADGLQTIGRSGKQWRVLVRSRVDGSRVVVGQLTEYRNEIASGSALRHAVSRRPALVIPGDATGDATGDPPGDAGADTMPGRGTPAADGAAALVAGAEYRV